MFGWIKSLFGIKEVEKAVEAIQPEPVVKEVKPKKPAKKKAAPKTVTPNFEGMTKVRLEAWAKENLNFDVDRRHKKDYIIEAIKTKLKEK